MTRDRAFLLRHPLAVTGIILTTVSAVLFIALAAAMFLGLLTNPYAGLVVFIALPLLFVIGLLLIQIGIRLQRKALAEGRAVEDWPVLDFRQPHTRRTALVVASLTALNVVILLVAGYGSLKWMESPAFCGATCHEPMHPQYTAWQNAPHSNIHCVECHIGEGGRAFVKYKLAGVRQLFHVVTNSYPRPIPGVPPERNLNGISFAVANATGALAARLETNPGVCAAAEVMELMGAGQTGGFSLHPRGAVG